MRKRKTHEEFIREMKIKNPNIEILEEYISSSTKIKCKCLIDNFEWNISPNSLLSGHGCPKCGVNNMANKQTKTHKEFIDEMKIKSPNIKILGEYIRNRIKIKCQCSIDGHIWEAIPSNLLSGVGCPKCAGRLKKTHKEFIEEMKFKNPNIKILGKYITSRTKIKCKCIKDGHIWEATPHNLLWGTKCPKCSGKLKKPHEQFVEEMKIKNSNIKILGKYTGVDSKIKCKCLIDGYMWEAQPRHLLSGHGCRKCSGSLGKTHEQFVEEIKIKNPRIEILGEYISARTKIKCKCLVDGHIWYVKSANLLSGYGCPKCKFSKGERIIENYCKKNYLQYRSQYRIDKCRYKNPLPFDFALFNKNKLVGLIEYQGEQHYRVVEYFGGKLEYDKRKRNDQIKHNYCLSNGIPLIEIPYWIEDVENYLEEQIDKIINKPMQLSLV